MRGLVLVSEAPPGVSSIERSNDPRQSSAVAGHRASAREAEVIE